MANGKLTRWLHLGHRWLGVALGFLVLLWFVSGLIMLFVARPQLSEAERLAGLPVIEAGNVRVSPMGNALKRPADKTTVNFPAAPLRLRSERTYGNHHGGEVSSRNIKLTLPII